VSASYLVLDIETVLDPELSILPVTDAERLPAPPHHRIVVIGGLLFDATYGIQSLGIFHEAGDEAGILSAFARLLEERHPTLVTFNGRGFDLPVIATRCLRYGIPLRHYYRSPDVRHRFTADGHLDLMDYVADFGAARPSRLDIIARLCGMPGKVGIDGKDVGPLVQAGRISEVQNYCLGDVVQTAAVFLRIQLVRGELERDTYLGAMQRLIDVLRGDERLGSVAGAINEKRLLLAE
jgi:predicted PolB exonuclease-like 3'-5' exonuclease